jgi:hypothetical protein
MRLMLGTIGVVGILVMLLLVRMKPREMPQPEAATPAVSVAAAVEDSPQMVAQNECWTSDDSATGSAPLAEILPQPRLVRPWQEVFFHNPSSDFHTVPNKDRDPFWIVNSPSAKAVLNQLDLVPEVTFHLNGDGPSRPQGLSQEKMEKYLAEKRETPELASLPWRKGKECTIEKARAEKIGTFSRDFRRALSESELSLTRGPNQVQKLVELWKQIRTLTAKLTKQPNAARLMMQIMQAEDAFYRMMLVELLQESRGVEAVEALTKLAVFDPDERVRGRAIERLWGKSRDDYRRVLVESLRHVWQPASANAAEALISLRSTDAVPDLVGLLDLPDPAAPFASKEAGRVLVRELVRLNHNHSCVLCHAPAGDGESPRRGSVFAAPSPVRPLLEFPDVLYYSRGGLNIRIDVTSLRQDFSAKVACYDNGKWPERQRYDFFTRVRPATPAELADAGKRAGRDYPQRQHVLRALRELTGKDGGDDAEAWKKIAREMPPDGRR